MYANVRRYEGIGNVRSEVVTRKVGESLLPSRAGGCGAGRGLQKSFLRLATETIASQRQRIFQGGLS
jgi:hypothetical protein